jgi:hypothetical protein
MDIIEQDIGGARSRSATHRQVTRQRSAALIGRVILGAAALIVAPVVSAANASRLDVTLDVKPVGSVSVSRDGSDGLKAAVAYRLQFVNSGGNTVNQVVLNAFTTVNPSGTAPYAAFVNNDLSTNPNCTQPPAVLGPTSLTCAIGQLRAGETRDFFLIFQTPTAGDTVTFTGNIGYSEGSSSGTPTSSFTQSVTNTIDLTTDDATLVNKSVKTVLAPTGGTFYTGPNGQANAANLFSTTVQVPATSGVVTSNSIDQDSKGSFACAPGYYCYGLLSTIEIRDAKDETKKVHFDDFGVDKIVTIFLRQDVASLSVKKPIPKVGDVKIFYNPSPDPDPNAPIVVGEEVLACVNGTPVVIPATESTPKIIKPCVADRKSFVKGNKGYYQYEIRTYENGRIGW